jgi:hypothetical protein
MEGIVRESSMAREAPMNRCKDYFCFAVWFAGLATIALWLVTSPHAGGRLLGDHLFCRADAFAPLGRLCFSVHPLPLPLQALGAVSAFVVIAQLLLKVLRRPRPPRAEVSVPAPAPVGGGTHQRWQASRHITSVKARSHFGLRGPPR